MTEKEMKLMKEVMAEYGSHVVRDGENVVMPLRTREDMDSVIMKDEKKDRNIRNSIASAATVDDELRKKFSVCWWAREEHQSGLDPLYYKLRGRLRRAGGAMVCFARSEPDLSLLLEFGQFWPGYNADQLYKDGGCCKDPVTMAAENGWQFCTGYALSNDGIWRQHSWCIVALKRSVRIIETESPKVLYYGLVHDPRLEEIFAFNPFVSLSWTKSELEHCIEMCGCIPDDLSVATLANSLKHDTDSRNILCRRASDIELTPADETNAALRRLGVSLPACNLCDHYSDGFCRCCKENKYRMDWDEALNCGKFNTKLPKKTLRYILRGSSLQDTDKKDYPFPIISIDKKRFPEPTQIVDAIKKSTFYAEKLCAVCDELTNEEIPDFWEFVDCTD